LERGKCGGFDGERDSRNEEDDFVAGGRKNLVDAAGDIAEQAREAIVGDDAHADFVRYKKDGARVVFCGEQGILAGGENRIFREDGTGLFGVVEEVVCPEGEAIHEHDGCGRAGSEGGRQVGRTFDGLPVASGAFGLVGGNAGFHFAVDTRAGCDVGTGGGEGFCAELGVRAFAAATSAGDKDEMVVGRSVFVHGRGGGERRRREAPPE